jgi:sulfate permease, SulP family
MMASPTTPTRGGWLRRYLPIWAWLPAYQRSWLGLDVIAGLTVWVLVIPEAVAYAQIAGVPPQVVLAAAPVALLAYALFGTSRQVVVGSTSSIAILTAAIIAPMAAGGSERYLALTAGLAMLVGALFVLSSLLRLGFVSAFLSRSVVTGFLFGLALVIAIGQVGKLFGITTGSGSGDFFMEAWQFITHLGETNGWTLLIGVLSLAILFGLPRVFPRIPAALVALVFGILVVSLFNMEQRGVAIVGTIPGGFPQLKIPAIGLSDLLALLPGALGLMLVAYSEHTGAASASASRHHYDLDANQELFAVGIANLGAGLFQGFAVGGSLSRSTANDAAGARSQVSSLVASALVLLTAIALTPLFYNLPQATLGAIVIRAVIGLMNVGELQRFYRLRKAAFVQALTAMLGVLTLGVLAGLLIAVALSLLILVYQASRPSIAVLGKVPGKQAYGDIEQYPENEAIPGLLMVRPDVQFFFANTNSFRNRVRELLQSTDPSPRAVLIDLQASARLDIDSVEMLTDLQTELKTQDIELLLANVRAPVRDVLQRSGLIERIGKQHIYLSVEEGVRAFQDGSRQESNREEI